MSQFDLIPETVFSLKNASMEKFINFKTTFGVNGEIPNYSAEIIRSDDKNFIRKVSTDMGFTGYLKAAIKTLVGATSIDAVENINYDLEKGEYRCVIEDPNEGKYRRFFSFREEYIVKQEGNDLVGRVNVNIKNGLPYPLDSYVQRSFFTQRHRKLKDELMASKINPNDPNEVEDNCSGSEKTKSLEQIAQEESDKLAKQIKQIEDDYYNQGCIYSDDDIPVC